MCKAYGGEPTVDLLRSFLNLGPAGDWLTLSNRGGADVPKALHNPITHLGNWKEMDFRSFMLGGVDGELNFLPAEGASKGQNAPSSKSNVADSDDPSYGEDEQTLIGPSLSPHREVSKKFKILGMRKVASGVPGKALPLKVQKAPAQASKVAGEASTPLDVDSDSDIHAKELKDVTDLGLENLSPHFIMPKLLMMLFEHGSLIRIGPMLNWKESVMRLFRIWRRILLSPICVLRSKLCKDKWMVFIIDSLKQDRATIVSKFIPDAAMKLIHSDDLANASYPFLAEYVTNPYVSLEQILSKKPSLFRPTFSGSRSKPSSLRVK
ncbi:hypothetical protein Tco_0398005 [Tanacetum coccineum]